MKNVEVGMFRLPGLTMQVPLPEELLQEMTVWAKENHCGTSMNETGSLWSFRNEKQREWFILRWIDHIPKEQVDEDV
jgi:hypothetical protein